MKGASKKTLDDVCEFIIDCLHATAPVQDEGYPLIRTPNIGRGRLQLDGVYRVSEDTYTKWTRRATPMANDLILAREAPAGNVAIVKNGQTVCLGQRTVHLRPDPQMVDPDFLCYFLLAPPQQGLLLAGETGATAKHVNMKDIRQLSLRHMPRLEEQRRSGRILAAYDDLIENNRRRIQLLEQAARLLYKEWFVHLRFPGHEHTKITDGVPEGWEKITIGESASFLSRGITPKYDDNAPGLVINQKCIRNRMVSLDLARRHSNQVPSTKIVQFGDMLINSTGAGTLGRVAQFLYEADGYTVDSHITIVRPREDIPVHYFGLCLASLESYIATLGRGATNQTELSKDDIAALEIIRPSSGHAQMFEKKVALFFRQIYILLGQVKKLSQARDLLLPRLMNGDYAV
ncbi:MAG: restriction endonuclease subunit S [Syntrophaceae bacterium]|nr:restriction endonuclease subunit S [Syntrophaceae bacterium]